MPEEPHEVSEQDREDFLHSALTAISGVEGNIVDQLQAVGMTKEAAEKFLIEHNKPKLSVVPPVVEAPKDGGFLPTKILHLPGQFGGYVNKKTTAVINLLRSASPEPKLTSLILELLWGKQPKDEAKISKEEKYALVAVFLREYLLKHGYFVHSEDQDLFYFFEWKDDDHGNEIEMCELYDFTAPQWGAFLSSISGINPSYAPFRYLHEECIRIALREDQKQVHKVAYYSKEINSLYLSRFDGTVIRLDGEDDLGRENNGQTVLFHDNPNYEPWDFVESSGGEVLDHVCYDLPNYKGDKEVYGFMLKAWILCTFMPELNPTKPILTMLGEAGSGKTSFLRMILKMLYGERQDVAGLPNDPDSFEAAAYAKHIYFLDNLDEMVKWLRDKLAVMSTGGLHEMREYYTNIKLKEVPYRTFPGVTSKSPETLQRDDLADRVLILPVIRIDKRIPESELNDYAQQNRLAFLGDIVKELNLIIRDIRWDNESHTSTIRLADFYIFAERLAKIDHKENEFKQLARIMQTDQSNMLLEDEQIIEALDEYVNTHTLPTVPVSSAELYRAFTGILYPSGYPPKGEWYTKQQFSIRLSAIRGFLKHDGLRYEYQETGKQRRTWLYWFE